MHRPTSILIPLALLTTTYAAALPAPQQNDAAPQAAATVTTTVISGITTTTESVTLSTIAPYVPPATETITAGIETSTAEVVVVPSGVATETVVVVQSSSGVATETVPVVVQESGVATETVAVVQSSSGVATETVSATATTSAEDEGGVAPITSGVATETVSVTITTDGGASQNTGGPIIIDTASASSQVSSLQSSLLEEMTKITSTQTAPSLSGGASTLEITSTVFASTITSIPSATRSATTLIGGGADGGDEEITTSRLTISRTASVTVSDEETLISVPSSTGSATGSVTTQAGEETGSFTTVIAGEPHTFLPCPTGVDRGLRNDFVCTVQTTSTVECEGGVCTATKSETATATVSVAPTGVRPTGSAGGQGGQAGNGTTTGAPPAFTGAASQLKAGAAVAAGLLGAMFALF